jgi:formate dehydrogenase maturation protein FdhE
MSAAMGNAAEHGAAKRPKSHEPTLIRRPLDRCPACGSAQLQAVTDIDEEGVRFLCGTCDRCWHVELGFVQRVHPDACHGCPQRQRCAEVFADDHATA